MYTFLDPKLLYYHIIVYTLSICFVYIYHIVCIYLVVYSLYYLKYNQSHRATVSYYAMYHMIHTVNTSISLYIIHTESCCYNPKSNLIILMYTGLQTPEPPALFCFNTPKSYQSIHLSVLSQIICLFCLFYILKSCMYIIYIFRQSTAKPHKGNQVNFLSNICLNHSHTQNNLCNHFLLLKLLFLFIVINLLI